MFSLLHEKIWFKIVKYHIQGIYLKKRIISICMCFKGEEPCFGNTCYMISETGKSWDENQKNCKASGGDLVSLETEAEWQFVNSKIQNIALQGANEWHIGLKKQGDWKWVNGNPMTIEKWQRSQPSGDGNVAVMSKDYPPGSQGLFNDLNAQMPRPFICEIPKGKLTATSSFGLFQRYLSSYLHLFYDDTLFFFYFFCLITLPFGCLVPRNNWYPGVVIQVPLKNHIFFLFRS